MTRRGVGRSTEHHFCAECDLTRLSCAAKIGTAARARVCVNQAAVTQLSRAEHDFRAGSRPLIMHPKGNARCAQSRQNVSAIYRRNGTDAPLSRVLRSERDSSEFGFIRKNLIRNEEQGGGMQKAKQKIYWQFNVPISDFESFIIRTLKVTSFKVVTLFFCTLVVYTIIYI